MLSDWAESSGIWAALALVGFLALVAMSVFLLLGRRERGSRGGRARDLQAGRDDAKRSADEKPRPTPPPGAPMAPPKPSPAARRPEGIGAASGEAGGDRAPPSPEPRPAAAPTPPEPTRSPEVARRKEEREQADGTLTGGARSAPPPPAEAPTAPPPVPMGAPLPGADEPVPASSRVGEDQGDHVAVTVHYGTDRRDTGDARDPGRRYSHERADIAQGQSPMSYGTCVVSIPKSHAVGELEDRTWLQWATLQERTPGQHVMVLHVAKLARQAFLDDLARLASQMGRKDAFVFVHGFGVTFADAARRTAQMAYDLNFRGLALFFSWPTPELSVGLLTAYPTSESNADLSKHRFRDFLKDVLETSGIEKVHLIAHSMGNRLVTEAVQMLDTPQTAHLRSRIGEVVLTAPDIDASVFITEIAPRLTRFTPRVTLYASAHDKALELSQGVHSFPRIGEIQSLFAVPQGIDVIDASGVYSGQDGDGHSYYGDSEPVIADLCLLINLGLRAAERRLTLAESRTPSGQPCWSVLKRPLAAVYAAILQRLGRPQPAATS